MDAQHAVNLGILRAFEARGIRLAYPTRTLFVHDESTRAGKREATP
jgi:small-conductance mechanosensitive channel